MPKQRNPGITEREMDYVLLLLNGHPNREIAKNLFVSVRTVEAVWGRLKNKFNCQNQHQLLVFLSRKLKAVDIA